AGTGAAETAHLKKFGKLLATFGTRMACLLRHLGPECPPRDRRKAHRLFAEAAAATHPALAALRAREANPAGGDGGSSGTDPANATSPSSWEVVAGIVYPKAAEAFLSTASSPPCMVASADGRELPRQGVAAAVAAPAGAAWAAIGGATELSAQGGARPLLASSGSSHGFGSAGADEDSRGETQGAGDALAGTGKGHGEGQDTAAAVCRCYKGRG
ncbi:unnamed protein product, partial [Laminaria digitata]